ncbi:serine/threonine-protein kinase [Vibrio parahaemolyticus]|uniref:serine/threonine-protein kinase n=1 Tax=Vibrio parahaemolyticus TaxID=670 RepID=UPI0022211F0A|nr:serine/threonine-protein kinase [Vibrio parahaemolyticus]
MGLSAISTKINSDIIQIANTSYKFKTIEFVGDGTFGYVEKIELFNMSETHSGFYARKILDQKIDLKAYKERFNREILAQCDCHHKHVVPIYTFDLSTDKPYFVMELGEIDVLKLIKQDQLDEDEKVKIMIHLAKGLLHIHTKGFLHRDIKPNNIILFSNGIYKISDFGLIRKIQPSQDSQVLTSIDTRLGNSHFIAPELMYVGNDYTIKSDIFAFGRVCEALTLSCPDLKTMIARCVEMNPRDRFDTMEDILMILESKVNSDD